MSSTTTDGAEGPDLQTLLRRLVDSQGSDLHLKPMRPPLVRVDGRLSPIDPQPLAPDRIVRMLDPVIPNRLHARLEENMAVEFSFGIAGLSRFRAAIFHQRGTRAAVFRRVAFEFPSLEDWGLPPVLAKFCDLPQGLVLITGPTGSGKSSTLAALMGRVAAERAHHIVTIEDPIEFVIQDDVASVSQREVGIDTPTFSMALHNALRQDPDIIMVGEMRDEETMRTVLTAAETGHLVFSTLHTNSAVQTVDRIVSVFPKDSHEQIRQQLAAVLEAVVSLQLVPRADGKGMVAAVEIMRRTPQISKLIAQGDFQSLEEAVETSVTYHKMQTMNQSLAALVIHGVIEKETAKSVTSNPSDLDLMLRKIVGDPALGGHQQGDGMAEPTSDFSRIMELLEIKKLHDELQDRYDQDVRARDQEIAELREEIARTADRGAEEARIAELVAENERLTSQIQSFRSDYESKIERLNHRIRELSTKASAPPPEPERKGFFRR